MKKYKKDPIPEEFNSYAEAGEFWDTHSAADYWDQMEDVECEVDIRSRHFVVTLEDEIYQLVKRCASEQNLSPDVFLNKFLRKRLNAESSLSIN